MPKAEEDDMEKHTLFLYKGDFHKLGSFFPEITASAALRRLVRETIKRLEARMPKSNVKVKGELDV